MFVNTGGQRRVDPSGGVALTETRREREKTSKDNECDSVKENAEEHCRTQSRAGLKVGFDQLHGHRRVGRDRHGRSESHKMIERKRTISVRSLFSDASRVSTEQIRNGIDDRADRGRKSPGRESVGGSNEVKNTSRGSDSHRSSQQSGNSKVNRKNHDFNVR